VRSDWQENIKPAAKKRYADMLAKLGDRILDTHMGSGSSVIAALEFGYEMLACEIDEHYFAAAVERIGRYEQQGTFDMTRNVVREPSRTHDTQQPET